MKKKILLLLMSFFLFLAVVPKTQILAEDENNTYYTVELNSITEDGEDVSNGVAQVSGLPLGGLVEANKDYSFTAYNNDLYEFSYWEINGVKQNNSSNILTGSYNKNSVVNAVYSFKGEKELTLTVSGLKPFSVKTTEGTTPATDNDGKYSYSGNFESFASVELIYEDNNSDFVAWTDSVHNVLSSNASYGFKITENTVITLTTYESGKSTYLAKLYSTSGKFVSTCEFSDVETLVAGISGASTPSKLGYKFDGWLLAKTKIDATTEWTFITSKLDNNMISLKASYTKGEEKATITIVKRIDDVEGSPTTKEVRIGDVTKLVAGSVSGKSFICWAVKEGDKYVPVTTSTTYLLHVAANKTVYAVYSSTEKHEEKASVGVSNIISEEPAGGKNKIFFEVNRAVPASSTLTGHGIIYSSYDFSSKTNEEKLSSIMFDEDGNLKENLKVFKGENLDKNNSFGAHLNVKTNVDTAIYFRGYIIVDGEIIYTPIYVGSYNSIKDGNYTIILPEDSSMPVQGNIITLSDGNEYRVLKTVDGTKVEVMALRNTNDAIKYWGENQTTSFSKDQTQTSGTKYEGSALDTYLVGWYNALNNVDATKSMYSAIQEMPVTQSLYASYDDDPGTYDYSYEHNGSGTYDYAVFQGDAASINRYVYALSIEDVFTYYDKDTLTLEEISKFFFDEIDKNSTVWLNTAYGGGEVRAWIGEEGIGFNSENVTGQNRFIGARPAFVIDLANTEFNNVTAYAKAIYYNENGDKDYTRIKGGITIKFAQGDHGKFSVQPEAIQLENNQKVDLTSSTYTPKADEGYEFIGFEYDDATNTFTAIYRDVKAKKGDILVLNDGKEYKVLDVKDNVAKVMTTYNVSDSQAYYVSDVDNQTAEFTTGTGTKYEDSALDNFLCDWYDSLETEQEDIYNAIQETTVTQYMYDFVETPDDSTTYQFEHIGNPAAYGLESYGSTTPIDRFVYTLDVKDIYDYFDSNSITFAQLNELLFDQTTRVAGSINLISAFKENSNYIHRWLVNGTSSVFEQSVDMNPYAVRAVFNIDLDSDGLEVENVTNYAKVSLTNKDGEDVTIKVKPGSYSFVAGEHASYEKDPGTYTFEANQSYNLMGKDFTVYIPTADAGYGFVGFIFDKANNKFTGYSIEVPEVGDLIELPDEQTYRVLSVDGANVKVVGLDDRHVMAYYPQDNKETTLFDGKEGFKYEDSQVDIYLNGTFYDSLPSSMQDAIVPQTITQKMYGIEMPIMYNGPYLFEIEVADLAQSMFGGESLYITEIGSCSDDPIERNVFSLDMKDVVDFLGDSNINQLNLAEMFYGNVGNIDGSPLDVLLSSAIGPCGFLETELYGEVEPSDFVGTAIISTDLPVSGMFCSAYSVESSVRPAFVINIAKGITYTEVEEEAKVIFNNKNGIETSIFVPGEIDVTFDGGEHGTLEVPSITATTGETFDFTGNTYIPTDVDEGYAFVGFAQSYNFDDSFECIFTAQYIKMPEKGDVIVLNDNNEYRVLDVDGTNVKLLALYNVKNGQMYSANPTTAKFGEDKVEGVCYAGSDLDNYLNNEWYQSLEKTYKPIHDAIVPQDIKQSMFIFCGRPDDTTNFETELGTAKYKTQNCWDEADYGNLIDKGSIDIGNRFVYALDVEDIHDYLEKDVWTSSDINLMFINTGSQDDEIDIYIWLRSTGSATGVNVVETYWGDIWCAAPSNNTYMETRPAFVLNLAGKGLDYSISHNVEHMPEVQDIITLNDGDDYRVLSVDGNKVLVMAMKDLGPNQKYNEESNTTDKFGKTGQAYDGSTVDEYLNSFYLSLKADATTLPMAKAIQEVTVEQNMYKWNSGEDDEYFAKGSYINGTKYYLTSEDYTSISIGKRHVFLLSLDDVVNYLDPENNEIVPTELNHMFFNSETDSRYVWLSSASGNDSSEAFVVYGGEGRIAGQGATTPAQVRPAFIIDLSREGVEFTDNTTDAKIKYINENGDEATARVLPEKTITFNQGDHGSYTTTPENIVTVTKTSYDCTTASYKPTTVDEGYVFAGYKYDYQNHVFTAVYKEIPQKGDIITLNDGRDYRVLKVDGNNVEVVGLFSAGSYESYYYYGESVEYWNSNTQNTSFNGYEAPSYAGSTLDIYLNSDGTAGEDLYFYCNLPAEMKNAIVSNTITQSLYKRIDPYDFEMDDNDFSGLAYKYENSEESYDNLAYMGSATPIERKVYALGIEDIFDYYETNKVSSNQIDQLFFPCGDVDPYNRYWLNSAWCGYNYLTNLSHAYYYHYSNSMYYGEVGALNYVQPAFVINLAASGVKFENVSTEAKITYINGEGNEKTVNILPDTTISFDFGDHSTSANSPAPITLGESEVKDITNDPTYIPEVASGYLFVGYNYDSSTYTFTAKYKALPSKGDVIKLNDKNNMYKVLSVSGTEVRVFPIDVYKQMAFNSSETYTYNGSDLDKYFENTWYNDLQASDPEIYAAIKGHDVSQSTYGITTERPNDYVASFTGDNGTVYYTKDSKNSIGTRHAAALTLEDIVEFVGKNDINSSDVYDMFGFWDSNLSLWLASSIPNTSVLTANGVDGVSGTTYDNSEVYAYPAFYIDLASEDINYNIIPKLGDTILLSDGSEYKVIKLLEGSYAKLMSMSGNNITKFNYESKTVEFETDQGTYLGQQYEGSDIDNYLNNTWYQNLARYEKTKPIYDAIINQENLTQDMYEFGYSNVQDDTISDGVTFKQYRYDGEYYDYIYKGSVTIGDRKVFNVGLGDVFSFYNQRLLSYKELQQFFFNKIESFGSEQSTVALNSVPYDYSNNTYVYSGLSRYIAMTNYDSYYYIARPTFIVDMLSEGFNFEIVSPDAEVTYYNEKGKKTIVRILPGTNVSFEAGQYGTYATAPTLTISDNTPIDITSGEYIPTVNTDGMSFRGFKYNAKTNTFTATYNFPLPEKGDLITLNDGKTYRVLSMDGSIAKVMAMYSPADVKYNEEENITDAFGFDGQKYDGSTLDNYLNGIWYEDLRYYENTMPMYNAIQLTEGLTQNAYYISINETPVTDEYVAEGIESRGYSYVVYEKGNTINIGDRYVYALSVQDVVDYLDPVGRKINLDDLMYMFHNGKEYNIKAVWLSSASKFYDDSSFACTAADDSYKNISLCQADGELEARPVFSINLKAKDVLFDNISVDAKVIYTNENGEETFIKFAPETTVSFNAGKHGQYTNQAPSLSLNEHQVLDVTSEDVKEKYIPTASEGYTFIGFDYDAYTRLFTAKYSYDAAPEKGDIVRLNDGHNYRVLSVDENNAKLLYMDSDLSSIGSSSSSPYIDDTIGDLDLNGEIYESTALDDYLNETWYHSLDDSASDNITAPMYHAIQENEIFVQNLFMYYDEPNDTTTFADADGRTIRYKYENNWNSDNYDNYTFMGDVIDYQPRHVYTMDVKDVYEYYGKNVISSEEINDLFYNKKTAENNYIWLSSIVTNSLQGDDSGRYYAQVDGNNGTFIRADLHETTASVRPVFVIDLSYDGLIVTQYNPTIKFNDEQGQSKQFKLTAGDTYTFDAGDHGEYSSPLSITLEPYINYDLTSDTYKPTTDEGYTFIGFEFDSDAKTFTAICIAIPNKGDDIILNDGNEYKVLDVDGTNVKLLALYNVKDDQEYWPKKGQQTTKFGASQTDGVMYEGSDLDVYLETVWYPSLETSCKPIYDAIVPQEIEQSMYKWCDEPNSTTNFETEIGTASYKMQSEWNDVDYDNFIYAGSVSVGERHAYAPDIEDIFDYLGKNVSTSDELNMLFKNDTAKSPLYVWIRTTASATAVYTTDCNWGNCSTVVLNYTAKYHARPEFVLDLTGKGLDYSVSHKVDNMPEVQDIIELDDGKDYRVLSVNGNKAFVVAMENICTNTYYNSSIDSNRTDEFGKLGQAYKGSNIDECINNYYLSLKNDPDTLPMANAILEVPLEQYMYKLVYAEPANGYVAKGSYIDDLDKTNVDYYISLEDYTPVSVGNRHMFLLDIKDVADYLDPENKEIIPTELSHMFFNTETISGSVWLASSCGNGPDQVFVAQSDPSRIGRIITSQQSRVRPAFIIDLGREGVSFVDKTIDAKVNYYNEDGIEKTIRILPETSITFEAGDHGSYGSDPSFTTTTKGSYDLTTDPYKPSTVDEGYVFVGYKYDYENHKFTALYKEIPLKGDIITLNDGFNYRVLNVDGTNVEVVGMYSIGGWDDDPFGFGNDYHYWKSNMETTSFNGYVAPKYEGSTLDKYLNTENNFDSFLYFFNVIPKEMRNAIVPNIITQNMYQWVYEPSSPIDDDDFSEVTYKYEDNGEIENMRYLGSATPIERKVYALGVEDIYEYYETNKVSAADIDQLFGVYDQFFEPVYWLNSSYRGSDPDEELYYAWCYQGNAGSFDTVNVDVALKVQPAFVIDLASNGVVFDDVSTEAKLIYIDSEGKEKTRYIFPGTIVNFDFGDLSISGSNPSPITLGESEVKDITSDPTYIPEAVSGYVFDGYDYDSFTHTLIAKYSPDNIVEKGEIIKLNNGKYYRVLDVHGSDVKVVCIDANAASKYNDPSNTTTFGDDTYIGEDYSGSALDTYLNTTWYEKLNTTGGSAIYDAIKPSPVSQSMYLYSYLDDENDMTDDQGNEVTYRFEFNGYYGGLTLLGTNNIGNRNVHSLGIEDLYEYYGTDLITSDMLSSFRNTTTSHQILFLSSVYYDDVEEAAMLNENYSFEYYYVFDMSGVVDQANVLPVFVFDASHEGVVIRRKDPAVKYNDSTGNPQKITLAAGDTITITSTDAHCSYTAPITKDLGEYQLIDLMSDEYKPTTIDEDYVLYGFEYDEASKTFNAVCGIELPKKGEVIKLNDDNRYRVLDVKGTNVKVLALDDAASKSYYWEENETTTFTPKTGEVNRNAVKYEGSSLDQFMSDWFAALQVSDPDMAAAIVPQEIYQHLYTFYKTEATSDSYYVKESYYDTFFDESGNYYFEENYNPVLVGDREVFALGLEDIVEYLGKDLNSALVNNMFIDCDGIGRNSKDIWLNSAIFSTELSAAIVSCTKGTIMEAYSSGSLVVHPAFVINLAADNVDYEIEKKETLQKGDVITLTNNGEDYKVLSVDGNNAKLLSLYSPKKTQYYSDTVTTTDFNGKQGPSYAGSDIDNYLENEFYEGLKKSNPSMHDAIIPTSGIVQNMYEFVTDDATDDSTWTTADSKDIAFKIQNSAMPSAYFNFIYVGSAEPITRNVYTLDLKDIYDYYGGNKKIFMYSDIGNIFFPGLATSSDWPTLMTLSYLPSTPDNIYSLELGTSYEAQYSVFTSEIDAYNDFFPVFTMDMSHYGIHYEIKSRESD